eukprot:2521231-Pleurochrysis_carterae.AAC.1
MAVGRTGSSSERARNVKGTMVGVRLPPAREGRLTVSVVRLKYFREWQGQIPDSARLAVLTKAPRQTSPCLYLTLDVRGRYEPRHACVEQRASSR